MQRNKSSYVPEAFIYMKQATYFNLPREFENLFKNWKMQFFASLAHTLVGSQLLTSSGEWGIPPLLEGRRKMPPQNKMGALWETAILFSPLWGSTYRKHFAASLPPQRCWHFLTSMCLLGSISLFCSYLVSVVTQQRFCSRLTTQSPWGLISKAIWIQFHISTVNGY